MTDNDAKDAVLETLGILPKPITHAQLEQVISDVLEGKQQKDFLAWSKKNGQVFIRQYNNR